MATPWVLNVMDITRRRRCRMSVEKESKRVLFDPVRGRIMVLGYAFSTNILSRWDKEKERQTDELVLKLYDLTYEEVLVVCPDFWLSEQEYERVEIE